MTPRAPAGTSRVERPLQSGGKWRERGYCEAIHKPIADALLPLPAGYRTLFERAVQVFEADPRVRGLWLSGSVGRGAADAASDLDLLVAVADDRHLEFAAAWREWLARITPTVLAGELVFRPGSFWSVTPTFERFDVVVEAVAQIPDSPFPLRMTVFDLEGLTDKLPVRGARHADPAAVTALLENFFHFSAMLEVILWREEWLLAVEHLHMLRGLLFSLYVEMNQPLPPMGLKRWSEKLTHQQREVLRRIPTTATSRDEVIAAHLRVSRAFLTPARALAAELEVPWPHHLADAAARHLREVLGVAEPYPE